MLIYSLTNKSNCVVYFIVQDEEKVDVHIVTNGINRRHIVRCSRSENREGARKVYKEFLMKGYTRV